MSNRNATAHLATETIDWCNHLTKRTTSAKMDDLCSRAPVVVMVPDEGTADFVRRLSEDWHRSGVAGASEITVRLGGSWML